MLLDMRSFWRTIDHGSLRDISLVCLADAIVGASFGAITVSGGLRPWVPITMSVLVFAGGAQFAQTQFCMDAGVVRRYAQCLADNGIGNFHLLIGVVPLRSAKSARWIREKLFGSVIPDAIVERLERAEDPVREGRRIMLEVVEQLSGIPLVSGVHVMAPGNDTGMAEVVAEAAAVAQRNTQRLAGRQDDQAAGGLQLHLQ